MKLPCTLEDSLNDSSYKIIFYSSGMMKSTVKSRAQKVFDKDCLGRMSMINDK